MRAKNQYLYPATPERLHQYAKLLFQAIKRGEGATTVWVSMAGRRMWNRFLIENPHLFKKELPDYQKHLLVYIEPLDLTEESLRGYLRLMGQSLIEACRKHERCTQGVELSEKIEVFEDESASYPKLLAASKAILREVIKVGFEVTFFLGEFDELGFANRIFYNNLKSLWDNLKPKLHYVFLSIKDLTTTKVTERLGELNAATLQNVIYVSLFQGKDRDYLIGFFEDRLKGHFSAKEKKLIKKICGGHPYLVKATTRTLMNLKQEKTKPEDLEEKLMSHYELLSVVRRIFNLRSKRERGILRQIALGEVVKSSDDLKRLLKLGLVEEGEKGKYRLFGELFRVVSQKSQKTLKVSRGKEEEGLYLNQGAGIVCYNGKPVEEKFSAQEYNIVKFFLEESGKLRTRDDLSGILWGEESYEKYSDWAIDQVISKVRKKLSQLGSKAKLVTVRGRGYKLVSG